MSTLSNQPSSEMTWLDDIEGDELPELINSDDPFIRVEAGPGTGKTHGLKRRILRILHPKGLNLAQDKVLVVAFNRVIAKQLQQEVEKLLRDAKLSSKMPDIRTIHALCLEVIGEDIRILLPHEVEAMIYDVLEEHSIIKEKYNTHHNAEQALIADEAGHHEHPELRTAVRSWLLRHNASLIGDVPDKLLDRVRMGDTDFHPYLHIVVDEFQDLTQGEQELFARMLLPGGSFLALGDPRQSIYKFRGNDRLGLSKLEALLKATPDEISDITITHCRRCPGDVVKAANRLMSLATPAPSPMVPDLSRKANTHVVVWETPHQEAQGMAKAIVANIKAYPPGPDMRHLVMVTRCKFGYLLREEIYKINPKIRVDLSFTEGLLDTWAVREAFLLFCLLTDPDAATWRGWLGYQNMDDEQEFKAPKRNAAAYLNILSTCKDKINESVMRSYTEGDVKPKGAGSQNIRERAIRYFELKAKFSGIKAPKELIEKLFVITEWTNATDDDFKTASIDMKIVQDRAIELLEEIQEGNDAPTSDPELLRKVAQSLRYAIAVREPFASDQNIDLQVTTFWSAKGLTADHVYVVGLVQETIPGERRESYPGTDVEHEQEQRRLFYVSLTRSKNTLVLSRAKKVSKKDAYRLGIDTSSTSRNMVKLNISDYLRDIIDYLPDGVQGKDWKGC